MPVNTDNILSMQKEEHAQNDDVTLIDRFSSIASPLSATTDILYTEVDYCLNEFESVMVWHGKQVDVQSMRLSDKQGILSKCLMINELLREACLNESHLNGDPEFLAKQHIALLDFKSTQIAQQFTSSHSPKFKIISSQAAPGLVVGAQRKPNAIKPDEKKSVLVPVIDQVEKLKNLNSINSQSKVDLYNAEEGCGNLSSKSSQVPIHIDPLHPTKEIYETLTIKAKLRQRVGMDRTSHVTIQDIDAIMKQVVTIVQTEFMKRFPSSNDTRQIANASDY